MAPCVTAKLTDVHDQPHFRVNMAMDLEGSRLRKVFSKNFARILLIRVKHARDEDLMDEIVLIGEGQGLALATLSELH